MKTVVIISGGFHPFHSGHFSLYNEANKKFPDADIYVAATNDTSTRPFPFVIKQKLAQLAGVPENRFVQVRSPFRAEEITRNYDPNNTVLIFVRSEKDMNTSPKPGGIKKDGSPSYLQPLNKDLKPMNQHAYMTYLPTIKFGPGMTGASDIRAEWPTLDKQGKLDRVMSLYPRTQTNPALAATVVKMLDTAIGSQDVAEAPDSNFVGFMNKTLGQKTDAPVAKSSMPDFIKDAPAAGLDTMGYRAALNFGMKTLNKLTPTQKTKLSIKGEDGVVSWLASQANKQGLLITDEEDDTPGKFMQEDLQEVQDFLPEVFKDPAIKSWAFVLTDGEPLPKAPVVGPFSVSINPGLPGQNGYANANWKTLDTLDNLPDAVQLAQRLAQKNPKQFVGIWAADGKSAGFYWPGQGWRGLNEGVAEATGDEKFDTMMKKVAKTPTQAQRNAERIRQKREREEETRKHFANGGGFGPSPADKLSIRKGVAEGSDGWIGNPAKWKEAVLQAHGPDVVFKNYSHPGQPGKRSVHAWDVNGKIVGVYQRHNKMGMVQPNQQGVAENQPNQAGIGSNTSVVANTQPQTTTATTTNVAKPSVGTVQTTQPTQTTAATTPAAATNSMSTPPNPNITNLAKRLGVDPKRLQGELQNMQEDYLDEKRH
jgi:hypothetical protein